MRGRGVSRRPRRYPRTNVISKEAPSDGQLKYHTISDVNKTRSYQKFIKTTGVVPLDDVSDSYVIELEENIKGTSRKAKQEGWHTGVSYSSGRMLYNLVKKTRPNVVVETGVAKGVSTSYILAALNDNKKGRLISVDILKDAGFLVDKDLKSRWDFKCGTSLEVLPQLPVPHIDMFIHDSQHTYDTMMFEYQWAYPRLKKGGVLLSHDINKNDAFFDFAKEVDEEVMFIRSSDRGFVMGAIVKKRRKK